MPVKYYVQPPVGRCKLTHYANSENHKLPNGRIDTSAQGPLTFVRGVNIVDIRGQLRAEGETYFYCDDAAQATSHKPPNWTSTENRLIAEARARFDGKLRYGHADLGVSIGSWRQSWDMIAKRATQATASFKRVAKRLEDDRYSTQRLRYSARNRRRTRDLQRWRGDNQYLETPANLVLEGEFGWLPLISDAVKAFGVMGQPIPDGRVTGRARSSIFHTQDNPGSRPYGVKTWSGEQKVTICATVRVSNPNIWLLNQLGLLNLPGVAWDLVPWSFVVNLFTNLGQMANAVTAHVGLDIKNASTTSSLSYLREESLDWSLGGTIARSSNLVKAKSRVTGSIPFPPFYAKLPELNAELALIALSLAIQQVSRITRLLR